MPVYSGYETYYEADLAVIDGWTGDEDSLSDEIWDSLPLGQYGMYLTDDSIEIRPDGPAKLEHCPLGYTWWHRGRSIQSEHVFPDRRSAMAAALKADTVITACLSRVLVLIMEEIKLFTTGKQRAMFTSDVIQRDGKQVSVAIDMTARLTFHACTGVDPLCAFTSYCGIPTGVARAIWDTMTVYGAYYGTEIILHDGMPVDYKLTVTPEKRTALAYSKQCSGRIIVDRNNRVINSRKAFG